MFFGDCPTKPRFWAKQPHGTSRTGHEGRGRTRRKLADDDDDESRAPSAHPPRIPHCPLFHLNKNKSPDRAPLLADDKTGRNNARQTKANSSCVAPPHARFFFCVCAPFVEKRKSNHSPATPPFWQSPVTSERLRHVQSTEQLQLRGGNSTRMKDASSLVRVRNGLR